MRSTSFFFVLRMEASQKGRARPNRRAPGFLDFGILLTTSILLACHSQQHTLTRFFVVLSLRTQARLSITSRFQHSLLCSSVSLASEITSASCKWLFKKKILPHHRQWQKRETCRWSSLKRIGMNINAEWDGGSFPDFFKDSRFDLRWSSSGA